MPDQMATMQDLPLSYSAPGGMPSYRRSLALGFFYKFWNDVAIQLGLPEGEGVDPQAVVDLQREVSNGLVGFEELRCVPRIVTKQQEIMKILIRLI